MTLDGGTGGRCICPSLLPPFVDAKVIKQSNFLTFVPQATVELSAADALATSTQISNLNINPDDH